MAGLNQRVIAYVSDISNALRGIKRLENANTRLSKGLGRQYGRVSKVMSRTFEDMKRSSVEAVKATDPASGSVRRYTESVRLADGRMGELVTTEKILKNGTKKVTTSFNDAGKKTVSLGQNMARLAKRAAITIPIWLALRGAVMGTFRTISGGIKTIAEQDRAFQKARVNLQATAKNQEELNIQFDKLKKKTLELSLQTGKSVTDITNAFQRFATVGFDFEVAMTGASEATKLALARFGDTEENANALARAFKLLSDNSSDTISTSEQLSKTVALIAELWKDQAFEVDELAGALERFAPVANIANMSMEETIKILAALQTAGIRSTRAGRLLSTSVLQLNKNFDKLNSVLGLDINPEMYTTFELFQLVLNEINKLSKVSEFKAIEALNELFRVRAGQTAAALSKDLDNLISVLGKTANVKKFNNEVDEMTEKTFVLAERFTNVNKEIGKAFVQGLTGTRNFNDALKEIVKTLEIIQKNAYKTGNAIDTLVTGVGTLGFGVPFQQLYRAGRKAANKMAELNVEIKEGLLGNLDSSELEKLINIISKPIKLGDGIKDAIVPKPTIDALNKILEQKKQIGELTEEENKKTKQLNQYQSESNLVSTDEAKLNQQILKHRLAQLKSLGYQTSEILKAKGLLQEQLGIQEQFEDRLDRQLEIQRAINDEKRLESKLGADSIKLYQIAQKYGTDTAEEIGKVLSGQISFSDFVKSGGKELEIFKKQFGDEFEQQIAEAFFKGEPITKGFNFDLGFRGGEDIPIAEEGIRGEPDIKELAKTPKNLFPDKINSLSVTSLILSDKATKSVWDALNTVRQNIPKNEIPTRSLPSSINLGDIKIESATDVSNLMKSLEQAQEKQRKELFDKLNSFSGQVIKKTKDLLVGKQSPTW